MLGEIKSTIARYEKIGMNLKESRGKRRKEDNML